MLAAAAAAEQSARAVCEVLGECDFCVVYRRVMFEAKGLECRYGLNVIVEARERASERASEGEGS